MQKKILILTALGLLSMGGGCLKAIQHLIPQYSVTCRNNTGKTLSHVNLWFDDKLFAPSHDLDLAKGNVDSAGPIDYTVPKLVRIEWDSGPGSYPLPKDLTHHTYTLEVKKHLPKGWRKCCDEIIFIFNEDNTISLRARVFSGNLDDGTRRMKEYDEKGNIVAEW